MLCPWQQRRFFGRGMPAFHTLHCDLKGFPTPLRIPCLWIIPGPNPVILYLWSYSSPESDHRYKITGMRDNHWKRQPLAGPRRCAHRPGHRDRPGRKEPVRRRTPGAHHPPLMGALASNSTSRSVTTNTTSRLPSASPCSAMDSSIISRGNEEVGGPTEIWSRSPLAGEGEGMVGNLPARHQGTLPHLR